MGVNTFGRKARNHGRITGEPGRSRASAGTLAAAAMTFADIVIPPKTTKPDCHLVANEET